MVAAFKKVEGVTDAKVDFAKKLATVTFDPGKTTEEKVGKALEGSKYSCKKEEKKEGGG